MVCSEKRLLRPRSPGMVHETMDGQPEKCRRVAPSGASAVSCVQSLSVPLHKYDNRIYEREHLAPGMIPDTLHRLCCWLA